jgi:hypothetical protein
MYNTWTIIMHIKSHYMAFWACLVYRGTFHISHEEIITLLTKERVPTSVYIGLLNDETSNINKGFTYDFVMEEINDQKELFVYISENILDIDVFSKIEDIVAEIQETKNTVLEINLEQTITQK